MLNQQHTDLGATGTQFSHLVGLRRQELVAPVATGMIHKKQDKYAKVHFELRHHLHELLAEAS